MPKGLITDINMLEGTYWPILQRGIFYIYFDDFPSLVVQPLLINEKSNIRMKA